MSSSKGFELKLKSKDKKDVEESFKRHLSPYSPDGSGVKENTPLYGLVNCASEEIAHCHKRIDDLIVKDVAKAVAEELWQRLQKKTDIEKGEFIESLSSL